ncbi:MAG: DUF6029 family protein [Bacteroidales bacterium]|nr:DUF6029 family protein [Bacteroidales bacterium]
MKRIFLIITALTAIVCTLHANDSTAVVKAALESRSNAYVSDPLTGTVEEGKWFASNDYLKVDFFKGRFSAGVQGEGYFPAIIGYPLELKGFSLSNAYAAWTDTNWSLTAGTIYEQFGSGLLFRSWEDRNIGINNTVLGARASYNLAGILSMKALWGTPRYGIAFDSGTWVRGGDLAFSPTAFFPESQLSVSLEASLLNTLRKAAGTSETGFSARANFDWSGFFARLEYVGAGNAQGGNAQLAELGYNGGNLGVNVNLRRLDWMNAEIIPEKLSLVNLLNYIPALCTQYTYMLAGMHPYHAMPGDGLVAGETGGQIDVFYRFRRGTPLGGKRGTRVHMNFSTYYSIDGPHSYRPAGMLMRDFSADIEKSFSKKLRLNLLYSLQEFSPSYGTDDTRNRAHILVSDILYKFTDAFSMRAELQYLFTKQYFSVLPRENGDWAAALLELNFAPSWSVYFADMCNVGGTKNNYYNTGVSFTKAPFMVSLSWGRYKAGYLCSGGVCRMVPAYTGGGLNVNISF